MADPEMDQRSHELNLMHLENCRWFSTSSCRCCLSLGFQGNRLCCAILSIESHICSSELIVLERSITSCSRSVWELNTYHRHRQAMIRHIAWWYIIAGNTVTRINLWAHPKVNIKLWIWFIQSSYIILDFRRGKHLSTVNRQIPWIFHCRCP
jgi:hypothetical protein